MLGRGLFTRIGAYAALALGFWLLFQAFERSSPVMGVLGGVLVLVGMYLMTGVWRDTFDRFGDRFGGNYKLRKENRSSDDTPEDTTEGTGDTVDGGDQGGQLPP